MTTIKCVECGKPIKNAYYLNGKAYGYNCYKQKLALIYKQWEDEHNTEYSIKCFSAMQVFESKKSNSFHDSICKQWNECKKLTAKQLNCIIKGFSFSEMIQFYKTWFLLADDENKRAIASWTENIISKERKFYAFVEDEEIHNILLVSVNYRRYGFHFWHDIEDEPQEIFISANGKENTFLQENIEDEYIEVLKIVKGNLKNK